MQKRNLDIQYGNTNEEEIKNGYTFVIPDDKYKNISISYNQEEDKKQEKKKGKDKKSSVK